MRFKIHGFAPIDTTSRRRQAPDKSGPGLPPVVQQARNLAAAVVTNVKSLARGAPALVDKETASARFRICEACDLYRPNDQRCGHPRCSCYLRFKTWLRAEKCPADKWVAPLGVNL